MKRAVLLRIRTLALVALILLCLVFPPAAALQGPVDCSKVILSYFPNPPEAGETIYLNAGVNSAIGNAPGYYGRWEIGGEDLGGAAIDEWDGCTTVAQFVYFCNGSQQKKPLIINGADCSTKGRLRSMGGLALLVGAVVVVGLVLRLLGRKKGPAYQVQVPPAQASQAPPRMAGPGTQYCGQCGAALVPGDSFCRACGRRIS